MPLPSEIRAQEQAKREAAGLGGDSEPVSASPASAPANTAKSFTPSKPRKSWNDPAPQEKEDLGWTSSDEDTPPPANTSAPKSNAKVKQIAKQHMSAQPAPAPAPRPKPAPAPAPAPAVAPKKQLFESDSDEEPPKVTSPTVVQPARRSVKDMIKATEGAQGEGAAPKQSVHDVVKQAKGAYGAAKSLTRTTKQAANSTTTEEVVVPAQMEQKFKKDDLAAYQKAFKEFDSDGSGEIDASELSAVLSKLGMPMSKAEVGDFIKEFDLDSSGAISFGEFLNLMEKAKKGMIEGRAKDMVRTIQKGVDVQKVQGIAGGYHGYTEEEKRFYASFINQALAHDPQLGHILPIDLDGDALFHAVEDGILPCKMVNLAYPGTIDERVITNDPKNVFQKNQNATLALNAARSIGCQFVGIAAMDLINGEAHLVLALLWQLVKAAVLAHISLKEHPYLVRLLKDGETVESLMKLPPEKILIRWVNFILSEAGSSRKVKNFGQDIKDSEVYLTLLNRIDNDACSMSPLEDEDLHNRATQVLRNAGGLGISASLTATDIVKGNAKMNLIFVADLFNKYPCLEPLTEQEATEVVATATDMLDFSNEGTREERVFRLWINALDLPDVFVSNLFQDLSDGYILLQVLDQIYGTVNWKATIKNPGTIYKRLENCNCAVATAKEAGLKLKGIDGQNIADGTPMYVLAFVWQLWRANLTDLLVKAGGNDKKPDEKTIVRWMNSKIEKSGIKVSGFKDKSLSNSHAILHVLTALQPDSVDWGIVSDGETEEDQKSNAEYAISVARKIGCVIFTLPEDIVEVHSKQLMVLVAMMMLKEMSE